MKKLIFLLLIFYTSVFGDIIFDKNIQNLEFKNQFYLTLNDFKKEYSNYNHILDSLKIEIELTDIRMNGYYLPEKHEVKLTIPRKMYQEYIKEKYSKKEWYSIINFGFFDSYKEDFNDFINNCFRHELTHSIGGNEYAAAKNQNRFLNNKYFLKDLDIYLNDIYIDDVKTVSLFHKHLEKYLNESTDLKYMFLFKIENLSKLFTGSVLMSNSRAHDAKNLYVNYIEYSSIILQKEKDFIDIKNKVTLKSDVPFGIIHNIFMNIKENGSEIDFDNILLSKMLEDFYLQTGKYFKSYEEYIIMCNETKELVEYKYKLEREKYIM